jgi:hypothetical protein
MPRSGRADGPNPTNNGNGRSCTRITREGGARSPLDANRRKDTLKGGHRTAAGELEAPFRKRELLLGVHL